MSLRTHHILLGEINPGPNILFPSTVVAPKTSTVVAPKKKKKAGTGATVTPTTSGASGSVVNMSDIKSSVNVPTDVLSKRELEITSLLNMQTPEDDAINALVKKMTGVTNQELEGKIPDDVAAELRTRAAEKGLFYGLGANSPANRALTARDLGLSSVDIQQKGMAAGEMLVKVSEARREFNKTLAMTAQDTLENVRRGDLTAVDLMETSRVNNVKNLLAATEMLLSALDSYHGKAAVYATSKATDATRAAAGDMQGDFEAFLTQMRGLFKYLFK